MQTYNR